MLTQQALNGAREVMNLKYYARSEIIITWRATYDVTHFVGKKQLTKSCSLCWKVLGAHQLLRLF